MGWWPAAHLASPTSASLATPIPVSRTLLDLTSLHGGQARKEGVEGNEGRSRAGSICTQAALRVSALLAPAVAPRAQELAPAGSPGMAKHAPPLTCAPRSWHAKS